MVDIKDLGRMSDEGLDLIQKILLSETKEDVILEIERIKKENISEVIISTSSSLDGEMTAMYIKKMLEKENVNVYRIGYGLPVGADIEYADDITLMRALEGKKEM